jgi:peptidyl-tRNA hydrolase, PTH1 family
MWLFVGLGNPGQAYEKTRHNIGFMAIDVLLAHQSAQEISKTSFQGKLFKSANALYLKPATFMNLSGKSVQAVANFYKIDLDHIVVIHDDLDLPFGAVRFKRGGGDGGHNGLKSIDSMIGKDYLRCRIGIGKPIHKSEVSSFVLSSFDSIQESLLNKLLDHVSNAMLQLDKKPLAQIQSIYTLKGIEDLK